MSTARSAVVVHSTDASEVWLADGEHLGVHWQTALGLPAAAHHPADRRMPARGERGPAVGAARALLAAGWFLAESPLHAVPSANEAKRWAEAFQSDVGAAAQRFADLGWSWRTDRLSSLGVRRGRGDVLRGDVHLFGLVQPRERPFEARLTELTVSELLTRWRAGGALPDFLPAIVQRLQEDSLAHLSLDIEQAWEVAPGVRMLPVRSPTLPPAAHTNVFLVGAGQALLVEPATPFPEEVDRIVAWVNDAADDGLDVLAICATHHHPDHIGGASVLSERLGLPLWAHAATAQRAPRVSFDRLLQDGQVLHLTGDPEMRIRCVHTPGHAPGHLCFLDEASKALISGDMVAGVGTILVEKHDGDMGEYLESLAAIRSLTPSMLLPAHGGVIADPAACIDYYISHRLAREEKVFAALAARGPSAPDALGPTAYADTPRAAWPLAARAVEAHLIHLVALGRAHVVKERGREIYTAA